MILDISINIPPNENDEFMSEISAMVEFSAPEGLSLSNVFQSNINLKSKLEKHYNIKLELEYSQDSVSIVLLECDDGDLVELLENIRANLIDDLEKLKFKVENYSMLFMEHRVPEQYYSPVNKEFLN